MSPEHGSLVGRSVPLRPRASKPEVTVCVCRDRTGSVSGQSEVGDTEIQRRRRLGRNISSQVRVGGIEMKWCFTEDTSIWRDGWKIGDR